MSGVLDYINGFSLVPKLAIFAGLAVITHLTVIAVRTAASRVLSSQHGRRYQKARSVGTLATSALVFALYFLIFGLILREFGVSLTAYLASASVVGLAIGFGSQGVVQDVVTGLTFIFSDLVDVGDLVEISGQTGVVRAITMRFVELENAMGASVYIPNRTINNVINYPRGYIRCIVDITLRGDESAQKATEEMAVGLMHTVHEQFPGILINDPSLLGRISLGTGAKILRLKFRIWPNRGEPIETAFKQQLTARLMQSDSEYRPWMVAVTYEVEQRVTAGAGPWIWRRPRGSGSEPKTR